MAKMCPLDGCRRKKGMCIHDKIMMAMTSLGIVLAGAHWGLHWF